MKEKLFLAVFAAMLSMAPFASAECLTFTQQMQLYDMANQMGISNTTFVSIFEDLCQRSYSRNETETLLQQHQELIDLKAQLIDMKINSFNGSSIEQRVDERMQNYTDWFEEEISINKMLYAIYNATNRTSGSIDTSGLAEVSYVNDELAGVTNRVKALEGKIDSLQGNITNMRITAATTAAPFQAQDYIVWIFVLAAIIVGAHAFGLIDIGDLLRRKTKPMPEADYDNLASIRENAQMKEGSTDEDELESIEASREKLLEKLMEQKKAELMADEIKKAKSIEEVEEVRKKYEKQDASHTAGRKRIQPDKKRIRKHEGKDPAVNLDAD